MRQQTWLREAACCVDGLLHSIIRWVCVWLIVPVGMPSSSVRVSVFSRFCYCSGLPGWLENASQFVFLVSLADSLPALNRQTTTSVIFKSVPERKNATVGKVKKYLFDLELGLQLSMHTVDNTFFADWYFIQCHQHISETFGRNDTCLFHCSRYESVVWLPCKSWLLSWVKGAFPLLSRSAIIFYYYHYCFHLQLTISVRTNAKKQCFVFAAAV